MTEFYNAISGLVSEAHPDIIKKATTNNYVNRTIKLKKVDNNMTFRSDEIQVYEYGDGAVLTFNDEEAAYTFDRDDVVEVAESIVGSTAYVVSYVDTDRRDETTLEEHDE